MPALKRLEHAPPPDSSWMQPADPARSRQASGPSPTSFFCREISCAVNEAASRPMASGGATSVVAGAVVPGAVSAGAGNVSPAGSVGCGATVEAALSPSSPHAVTSTAASTRATRRRMEGAYRTPQARAVLGHGLKPRAS